MKIETGTKLNVAKIINFDDLIHVYSPFLGGVLPKFGAACSIIIIHIGYSYTQNQIFEDSKDIEL